MSHHAHFRLIAVCILASAGTSALSHPPIASHDPPGSPGSPGSGGGAHHTLSAESKQTIAFYEQRLAANPHDAISLSKLGALQLDLARESGEHTQLATAEATFRRLVEVTPDSLTGHIGIAYSLLGQHRFHDALILARESAYLAPDEPQVWALLGDIHFALGNDAEAEAFFVRCSEHELTLQSLARLALMQQHRGRFSEADVAWHEALEAGRLLNAPPADLAWCHTMIGEFDLLIMGDMDDAEAHFNAAMELNPEAHAAMWRLAQIAVLRDEFQQAETVLTKLVAISTRPAYRITLGDLYARMNRTAQSQALLLEVESQLAHDIEHGELGHARELVEFWLAHDGNPEQAAALALRDLHEVRQDVGAYETAAWALHCAKQHDQAVELIRAALRRSDANPQTRWRAAQIFAAGGFDREARLYEASARQMNPMIEQLMR